VIGILLLIVFNMALGYALALYLHRPELLSVAWRLVPSAMPPVTTHHGAAPALAAAGFASAASGMDTTVDMPVESVEKMLAEMASIPVVPSSASAEVQEAVSLLTEQLNRYCSKVGALDETVKQHRHDDSSTSVRAYVDEFNLLSKVYLEQQSVQLETIRQNPAPDVQAIVEPCQAAVDQHTAAIATTREEIAIAAGLTDSAASCRSFLEATTKLGDASDVLKAELSHVATGETDQDTAPIRRSTAGLEKAIAEFIGNQPNKDGKFSVALVDADQLPTIIENRGQETGDRILQEIVQTFIGLGPESTLAADKERQQLLFFQPEASARELTNSVEQARLRVEATTFQQGTLQLQVTLSCGVAEATGSESPAKIIRRLEKFLGEAQRYGRNRTFFQEGEQSAPAIPPVANVEKRVVEI
jgi:GGDEF domain-containing protein